MSSYDEDERVHVLCVLRAAATARPFGEDIPGIVALQLDPEGWSRLDAARRHLESMPDDILSLEIACPGVVVWLNGGEAEGASVAELRRVEPMSAAVCMVTRHGVSLAAAGADAGWDGGAWRADDGFGYVLTHCPTGDGELIGPEADAWLERAGLDLPEAIEQIEQLIELERLVAAVESAAGLLHRASAMAGP